MPFHSSLVTINILGICVSTVRMQHQMQLIKKYLSLGVLSAQFALCRYVLVAYCTCAHVSFDTEMKMNLLQVNITVATK